MAFFFTDFVLESRTFSKNFRLGGGLARSVLAALW
jgi:hypothetical protein